MTNDTGGCTFGKRLRAIRLHRGLTQRQLGLLAGFSPSSADIRIAQYETSTRHPKREVIVRLAEALQVEAVVLLSNAVGTELDFLQSLFWVEEFVGEEAIERCIDYWRSLKVLKDSGSFSPEQYLEMKVALSHPLFSQK